MFSKSLGNKNLTNLVFRLFRQFSHKRKRQLIILIGIMISSGFSEFLTISAIIPFLFALNNTESINQIPYISNLLSIFNLTTEKEIITFITLLFIFAALFSGFLRTINFWLSCKLSALIGSDLSIKAYDNKLNDPYEKQVRQNSSETLNLIVTCVNRAILSIYCFSQIITSILIAFFIISALLIINWKAVLIGFLLILICYLTFGFTIKKRIFNNSKKIISSSRIQIQTMQEGLGSVKDIILSGNYKPFIDEFIKADVMYRTLNAENKFLTVIPKYVIESLGLSIIAFLAYLFLITGVNKELFIPLLGSLALGAQRLLPVIQQIYTNWSLLIGFTPDLLKLLDVVEQKENSDKRIYNPYALKESIKLENIQYNYGERDKAISNLFLNIRAGETIGLIGRTGSGKSTTVDILMGLLKPSKGKVLIDNKELYDEKNSFLINWRRSIAHVPQSIYLSDNTFLMNIAFGIPLKKIDLHIVKLAAKEALISSFIESTSRGYRTNVGEYGVKLSGGQRQRLGIARAIYRLYTSEINLLVLDEATSSLDKNTESKIIKIIEKKKNLTKIIISHNLETLTSCNRVIDISQDFR